MITNQNADSSKLLHSLVSKFFLLLVWIISWLFERFGQLILSFFYISALVLYLGYTEFLKPNLIDKRVDIPRLIFSVRNLRKLRLPLKKISSKLRRDHFPSVSVSEIYRPTNTSSSNPEIIIAPNEVNNTSISSAWNLRLGLISKKRKRGRPRTQPLIRFYLGKIKRFLNIVFPKPLRIGLALAIIAGIILGYSYFLVIIAHDLPSPEKLSDLQGPLTTKFYDRNGKLLYQAYEGRNRTLVHLDQIPQNLVNATIAVEDKHFYDHPGVDFFAIIRAVISDAQGKQFQGGSTLTQQLIKNTLLTPEQTYDRKIKEVLLAYWAEKIYSKQQILQMYFNEAPYGGTAWGIEAASEYYFNKSVKDLDLAESALLAGLPASPTEYSPFGAHPEYTKQRQKQVLDQMVEDRFITQQQADEAKKEELAYATPNNFIKAPHFVMYVRDVLAQKYGEKVVSQGGLSVTTTLDLDTQQMAEGVVADQVAKLASLKVSNGAAMITDAKTGQILAMVGSKDYYDPEFGNYNVTLAKRQPGSSIKPITYATAFKQGYSPGTIMLDTPVAFKNAWETYAPVNYDGKFHGPVTVRTALGSSYNIPAVKMLDIVGIPNMIQTAKDLGITTFSDSNSYGLSLTLGAGEVKMIDMMSVYGTFSQQGVKHNITGILKVTDSKGVVLEDNENPQGVNVIDPGIAYLITNILTDNSARTPAFGPNSLLIIPGHTVAVKTGTTDNKKDNLAFGYTPDFVVGTWVGNNNNLAMDPQLTSGVTGATPIWSGIMTNLLNGKPDITFEKPANVVTASVDGHSDLVLNGLTPRSIVGLNKKKIRDNNQEKEVITFTDPFSVFTSDSIGIIKIQP